MTYQGGSDNELVSHVSHALGDPGLASQLCYAARSPLCLQRKYFCHRTYRRVST